MGPPGPTGAQGPQGPQGPAGTCNCPSGSGGSSMMLAPLLAERSRGWTGIIDPEKATLVIENGRITDVIYPDQSNGPMQPTRFDENPLMIIPKQPFGNKHQDPFPSTDSKSAGVPRAEEVDYTAEEHKGTAPEFTGPVYVELNDDAGGSTSESFESGPSGPTGPMDQQLMASHKNPRYQYKSFGSHKQE